MAHTKSNSMKRRLNMKKLICILLALCFCLSLAACAETAAKPAADGGSSPATAAPAPAASGSSQSASGTETQTPEDPMASTLVIGAKADFTNEGKNLIFDYLMFRISNFEAVPNVISSEHNADYSEYTLKVVPGIKFTDGTALTADMIKYSIESQLPTSNLGIGSVLESIEVKDDSTLILHLSDSYMNMDYELSYILCVKPGTVSDDGNFVEWVGTGPYVLTEHQQDVRAEFTRNEDYWNPAKKGTPKTVIWKVLPDETTRVMALEKKEVDVIGPDSHAASGISNSTLNEITKKGVLNIMSRVGGSPQTYMYNYTNGLMSDIELRKAVTYAVDRQAMLDTAAFGFGEVMGTFLDDSAQYAARNGEGYTYDPEMAKKILADAGYADTNGNGIVEKDGQDVVLQFVTFTGDTYRTIAVLFQESLKAVGIGMEINALENTIFYERTNSGDFDICMCHPWTTAMAYMTWRGGYSDYDNFGPGFGVNDNFPGYLETILTSTDKDEIYATFDKIWAEIYAAYPATPLYAGTSTYIYTDEVSGFLWTLGNGGNMIDLSEVVINRK